MRKELYRLLCSELKAIDLIKHIDLWNHNVEFIEQETGVPVRIISVGPDRDETIVR